MALFAPSANYLYTRLSYRVFLLILVGLLATSALAACGSDPDPTLEPTSAPAAVAPPAADSTAVNSQPVAAIEQPVQNANPAPVPSDSAPPMEPANTPAPTLAPITLGSSTTRRPQAAPTVAPGVDATGAGESQSPLPDGLTYADFGPDTTWGEVFSNFSEEEQSCIGAELGDERLEQIMEQPISAAEPNAEPAAVIGCISEETGRWLLLAILSAQFGGLPEAQNLCLWDLLGNFNVSDLVKGMAPEPDPGHGPIMMSFGLGLIGCIPELAGPTGSPGPGQDMTPAEGAIGQDPSLLWSFTAWGWVIPAPAVVDGVVYAGSDDHSLYALAAHTGELVWSFNTSDVIRSTPAVVDGRVFVGSNDNHIYALDAAAGTELWKFDTAEWVQHTPAVGGGKVYFGAYSEGDRRVHALDAATGEVVWVAQHPFPIGAEHTPTVIGDRVYSQGAEYGEFYALDAATGEVAWQAEVGGYVESAPTVLNGVVYLTVANRAYAFNEETGEVIWEVNTEEFPARDFPSLVVEGVYYLAPSNNVYALDAATGDRLWSYESGMLSTAPVVADGVLYGASEPAEYLFALDAATGEELWTETTEDFTSHSLQVVDGILYGQLDNGYLFASDNQDGSLVWEFEKGGFSDIRGYTVADGVVYSAGPNNSVYAHRAP